MSSIGHSAQDSVSGMGTVQIRYGVGLGGSVGYCNLQDCTLSASRKWCASRQRISWTAPSFGFGTATAGVQTDRHGMMEAAWNDGRSFGRMDEKA